MVKKQQKRVKHIPQRTCIGCKSTLAKRELVRVVRTDSGVIVDPTGKVAGRGAYVHNTRACWEQALKGSISHALRVELTQEDRERLTGYMNQLPGEETAAGQPGEISSPGTQGKK